MSGRDLTITKTIEGGVPSYQTHYDSRTDMGTYPSLWQAIEDIHSWLEYDCVTVPAMLPQTTSHQNLIEYATDELGIEYDVEYVKKEIKKTIPAQDFFAMGDEIKNYKLDKKNLLIEPDGYYYELWLDSITKENDGRITIMTKDKLAFTFDATAKVSFYAYV